MGSSASSETTTTINRPVSRQSDTRSVDGGIVVSKKDNNTTTTKTFNPIRDPATTTTTTTTTTATTAGGKGGVSGNGSRSSLASEFDVNFYDSSPVNKAQRQEEQKKASSPTKEVPVFRLPTQHVPTTTNNSADEITITSVATASTPISAAAIINTAKSMPSNLNHLESVDEGIEEYVAQTHVVFEAKSAPLARKKKAPSVDLSQEIDDILNTKDIKIPEIKPKSDFDAKKFHQVNKMSKPVYSESTYNSNADDDFETVPTTKAINARPMNDLTNSTTSSFHKPKNHKIMEESDEELLKRLGLDDF